MKVCCYEIQWDTDGADPEELGLPSEVTIETDLTEDELGDGLADELSDKYGWCINGLNYSVEK